MSKIPNDIIFDVFLLLPPKTLLRFRCLSKPFCSLVDCPDFIKRHLYQSSKTRSNLSLILRDWNLYSVDVDSLYNPIPTAPEPLAHPLQKGGGTEAVGSCNGLLALRNSERDLALYNPSTRKYKRLPVSEIEPPDRNLKTGYVFYGFGYDSINDDYKLVRMATFSGEDDTCESFHNDYEVKVYSLKSDSWKRINGLPSYLRFLYKPFFQVLHRRGYGVFACNALHWVMPHWPQLDFDNSIIAFDIMNDKFRRVVKPECLGQVDVGVLDGKLCAMLNRGHEYVDLLVMEEYGVKESWSKMFSFKATKSMGGLMCLRPLDYSKDGKKVLLEVNDHKLVWYDWNRASFRTVKLQDGPKSFGAQLCAGSLVMLDDGGEAEQNLKDEGEKDMRKANRKVRDDFLSVGFKLKL